VGAKSRADRGAHAAHGDATLPLGSKLLAVCVERFSLTVVEGPDRGATVEATTSEVSVGSAKGNTLVLGDPTVSRHHCSVSSTERGFVLRDLGSTNGTRVGAARVLVGLVDDGAVVQVGRTKLRLSALDDEIVEPLSAVDRFGDVLGASTAMRRIFALLPRLAASTSTVLLEGETGTGKGKLALALHAASPRAKGPFVVVDCASIPATLVESELFGHERGAFTGALESRAGAFEQAEGGTLFLDEIGELPLDMQPKLLRALEERTVKRVGGSKRTQLDVRFVAATNRDLRAEVNRGSFRADLYFRLDVVRLVVPPLRERRDDIALLARHLYQELAPGEAPSEALLASLERQSWPGNVRELRSAIERATLLAGLEGELERRDPWVERGEGVDLADAARREGVDLADAARREPARRRARRLEARPGDRAQPRELEPFRVAKERALVRWERAYLASLLEHVGGNLSEAARLASMDRSHLRDLLKRHGIRGGRSGADG
jgi:DNA-binding NtrC family response regulator